MSPYNPYAAPQAGPQSPMSPDPGVGAPQPWEIGEVLGHAWNMFKPNWATLVFSFLLGGFLTAIPNQLPAVLVQTGAVDQQSPAYAIVAIVCVLVYLVLNAFFQVGYIRIWLSAARGMNAQFGELFSGGGRMLSLIGVLFLMGLICIVGFILFIVPGIILSIGLSYSTYYVVDRNMGPIEAMKASWAATNGQKVNLFLFGLVSFLLLIGGYLACCVGAFVAIPVVGVASATIFLRLSGQWQTSGGAPPGYAPPGGYGPPGGGYGPPPGFGAPPAGGFGAPPAGGGYGPPPGGGGYGPPPGY